MKYSIYSELSSEEEMALALLEEWILYPWELLEICQYFTFTQKKKKKGRHFNCL